MSLKYELKHLSANAKEWYNLKFEEEIEYNSKTITELILDEETDTVKIHLKDGQIHVLPLIKLIRIHYK